MTAVASSATNLVIMLHTVGLDAAVPYSKGYWLVYMGAHFYRRGMVGHDCYGHLLIPFACLLNDGFHYPLVEILDALEFKVEITIMPCLVARLKM